MAYKLKWYTDEGNLRRIGREYLTRLLERYSAELARAGITVPVAVRDNEFYHELAGVFMRPEGIPDGLHEALFFIKELDNEIAEERIVEAVIEGDLDMDLDGELSRQDKVIEAWLQDEDLVRGIHLKAGLDKSKSFTHYLSEPDRDLVMARFETVKFDMEAVLSEVCGRKARQPWVTLNLHERGDEFVFVLNRTDTFRRETKREAGDTTPIFFWPMAQDLVVYNPEYRDLRMNVNSKWQKEAYLETFGQFMFGDARTFGEAPLYTLEPLRWRGRRALEARAFGIERIALTELHLRTGVTDSHILIHRAHDVFEVLEEIGPIPPEYEIVKAKFKIILEGSRTPRMVEVECPSRSKFKQDEFGAVIEHWLRNSGFVIRDEREAA